MISDGIKSGVNWTRANFQSNADASAGCFALPALAVSRHSVDRSLTFDAGYFEFVPELGPLTIAAHTRGQAEYLIRSRAEQRGVRLRSLEVSEAGHDVWSVTIVVDDGDVQCDGGGDRRLVPRGDRGDR